MELLARHLERDERIQGLFTPQAIASVHFYLRPDDENTRHTEIRLIRYPDRVYAFQIFDTKSRRLFAQVDGFQMPPEPWNLWKRVKSLEGRLPGIRTFLGI